MCWLQKTFTLHNFYFEKQQSHYSFYDFQFHYCLASFCRQADVFHVTTGEAFGAPLYTFSDQLWSLA